eukprot:COSAG01_NODE_6986_length_3403_cov_3.437651_3_plen_240_part_00
MFVVQRSGSPPALLTHPHRFVTPPLHPRGHVTRLVRPHSPPAGYLAAHFSSVGPRLASRTADSCAAMRPTGCCCHHACSTLLYALLGARRLHHSPNTSDTYLGGYDCPPRSGPSPHWSCYRPVTLLGVLASGQQATADRGCVHQGSHSAVPPHASPHPRVEAPAYSTRPLARPRGGEGGSPTKSGSAHLAPSRAPRTQHAATARLAGWLTPQCKLTQRQLSLNAETSLLLLLRLFIYFT